MATFKFTAKAVDGKSNGGSGIIDAANKQAAETEAKKRFTYPVTVVIEEFSDFTVMDPSALAEQLEGKWGVSAAPVAVAGTPSSSSKS